MFIPAVYSVALAMIVLSMICWGSWANTQKLCKGWRFELFYWDYVWGILLIALILGFTLGSTDTGSPDSFLQNLRAVDGHHYLLAFLGGVVFNLGNILIVAAIAIAGMAVAFPVGVGLALVVGSVLNYIITPKGNPLMLFGGIALVCLAIALDAVAYRRQSKGQAVSIRGIVVSVLGGVIMGLFYPFVAKAIKGENHFGPYTVAFVFVLGVLVSNFPLNYFLMRKPVSGPPVSVERLFSRRREMALLGPRGRHGVGRRHDLQLRRLLRPDGGPRSFLRARPGLDHGRRHLGCVCLERIQRR